MSAPQPHNIDDRTSVWDNPERFTLELNTYYAQLGSPLTTANHGATATTSERRTL